MGDERTAYQPPSVVSVLVLTYNHERFIAQTINSLTKQTFSESVEFLICDDASIDSTFSIVQQAARADERIKPIRNDRNLGPAENFRRGLKRCKGEFIAYCDGDDYWTTTTKLSYQINALRQNQDCSFSFHDMMIVDSNGNDIRVHSRGRANATWNEGVKRPGDFLAPPLLVVHASSLLFRSNTVDHNFLNDLDDISGLDYAIAIMLAASGNGYFFPQIMGCYRMHNTSISSRRDNKSLNKYIIDVLLLQAVANKHYEEKYRAYISANQAGHAEQIRTIKFEQSLNGGNPALVVWRAVQLLFAPSAIRSRRDRAWLIRQRLIHHVAGHRQLSGPQSELAGPESKHDDRKEKL